MLYLNDEGTEKILIEVDEEKPNQSLHPGTLKTVVSFFHVRTKLNYLWLLIIEEIILDETLRRTFPFTGFMNNYYNVQKVQNKNVNRL